MNNKRSILIISAICCLAICFLFLKSCRSYPTEEVSEIGPSQTAFIVPLEGATGKDQIKFDSESILKNAQVSTKRIKIPVVWHKTGYFYGSGKYIPSARIIVVDRALVTRSWERPKHINVESVESIAFDLEVFCNALIKEENAAKFLYWYGGKTLSEVIDTNIRADVSDSLAKKFGRITINQCREQKGKIFDEVHAEVTKIYSERGITITTLGLNGGLRYDDNKIQENINQEFVSLNKKIIADNEAQEQKIRNQIQIEKAEAEASAARALASAKEAFQAIRELEIEKIKAEKWDGKLPQFFIGNSSGMNMLLPVPNFLDKNTTITK